MIQYMTPQTYPMWAVERDRTDLLAVIGWESRDAGLAPIVVPVDTPFTTPRVARPGHTLFDVREFAMQAIERNTFTQASRSGPPPR